MVQVSIFAEVSDVGDAHPQTQVIAVKSTQPPDGLATAIRRRTS